MALRRILVVDDSPTIRRVVSQVLRTNGFDVATAENGDTGLAEARATRPDLILLDFMMPGMNGYQFVKQLDVEGDNSTPCVLMVTRADQVPEGALRSLGVVDTITKPFSPEAIVAVVTYSLERHGVAPRQETTRVTKLMEPFEDPPSPARPEDAATSPGMIRPGARSQPGAASNVEGVPSSGRDRTSADDAVRTIARALTEALLARGVPEAEAVATAACADLRASLAARTFGDAIPQGRPSLVGDLSAVPLPEVLQLIKFQGQTGLLEVAIEVGQPPTRARFEVAAKDGMIVSVHGVSLRADLLLGNYFVGAGMLSRQQLDAILRRSTGSTPPPIGQRLVEAGLVTTEQLRRCVGAQAQDLMTELLRARRGTFTLQRGDDLLPSTTQVNPGFSVDMMLFESLRRIDEWGLIEQHVPSFDARFVRASDDITDLSPDEIEVLSVFPAAKSSSTEALRARGLSVHDVLRISSLRAFECCKVLYRLCVLRRLRRVQDGTSAPLVDDVDTTTPALSVPISSSGVIPGALDSDAITGSVPVDGTVVADAGPIEGSATDDPPTGVRS